MQSKKLTTHVNVLSGERIRTNPTKFKLSDVPAGLKPGVSELNDAFMRHDVISVLKQVKQNPNRLKWLPSLNDKINDLINTVQDPKLLKLTIDCLRPYYLPLHGNKPGRDMLDEWLTSGLIRPPVVDNRNPKLSEQGKTLLGLFKSRLPNGHNIPVEQGRIESPHLLKGLRYLLPEKNEQTRTYSRDGGGHAHIITLHKPLAVTDDEKQKNVAILTFKDTEPQEAGGIFGSEVIVDLNTGIYLERSYKKKLKKGTKSIQLVPYKEQPALEWVGNELRYMLTGSRGPKKDAELRINGKPDAAFMQGLTTKQVKGLNHFLATLGPAWQKGNNPAGFSAQWLNKQLSE